MIEFESYIISEFILICCFFLNVFINYLFDNLFLYFQVLDLKLNNLI